MTKLQKENHGVKNGVHIMSGKRFLHHIFKGNEVNINRYLRRAIQTTI